MLCCFLVVVYTDRFACETSCFCTCGRGSGPIWRPRQAGSLFPILSRVVRRSYGLVSSVRVPFAVGRIAPVSGRPCRDIDPAPQDTRDSTKGENKIKTIN